MKIHIDRVMFNGGGRYPFSHRAEIKGAAQYELDELETWLKEHQIKYCRIGTNVLYLDSAGATLLILKWQA